MPTKIACVGNGWVAGRHLAVLAKLDDVAIVGVAGRSVERATALAETYGAAAFDDAECMLDITRPDALLICTIPGAHGAIEAAAIERGIPFLVEKPLAIDWDTAATIAAAVERSGLVTAVGYHWRYHETVDRAREFLQNRHVALVQGFWLDGTPPPAWWSRQNESGGQMVEQATHLFDLARLLVGEAREVHGLGAAVPRPERRGDVDEASAALVRFASGAIGTFAATSLLSGGYRVGLHLIGAGFVVEVGERTLVIDTGRERSEFRGVADPFVAEDSDFLAAVRGGDPRLVRSSYADALRTHRLTTSISAATRSGQPVAIDV